MKNLRQKNERQRRGTGYAVKAREKRLNGRLKPAVNAESTLQTLFHRALNETDENGVTVSETIIKSITEKACSGDLNAIKFLREFAPKEEEKTEEIKIIVID